MPTLAEHYEVDSVSANTLALVSPSMTPANGDVFVVKASIEGTPLVIGSPTGGSQAYRLDATSAAASHAPASIYTSTVSGSPGAMTITVPFAGSGRWHSAVFERWTNAVLAATPATNSTKVGTGAPSDTVTTIANNSAISSVNADFSATAPGTPAYRSSAVQDGLHDKSTGGFYVAYYFTQTAATSGAQTIGLTSPSTQTWTMLGIEIKDAGGAAPNIQRPPLVVSQAAIIRASTR